MFRVDPGFESLIPPLSEDEYSRLERSIIEEGVRDPIVTWRGVIIDGHNRFRICMEHGLECPNVERMFDDRSAAKIWIIENQFARRNIDKYIRGVLALQLEAMYAAEAKRRMTEGRNQYSPSQKSDEATHIRTDEQIAKLAGMSRDTIRKVKVIENEANSGNETAIAARDAVKSGNKSIHGAFTEVRNNGDKADERYLCTICGKPVDEGDHYPRDRFKHKACANELERKNKSNRSAGVAKFAEDGRRICSICDEPINQGEAYDYEPTCHKKCRTKQHVEAQRRYRDADRALRENVATYTVESLMAELLASAEQLRESWESSIRINESMGVKLRAGEKRRLDKAVAGLVAAIGKVKESNND